MRCFDLQKQSYSDTLALQEALAARARSSELFEDTALLVEHDPPVLTFGRRAKKEHVLASPELLAHRSIETHSVSRGGDVTWHGPGQLVLYCIRRLGRRSKSVHEHVEKLEETVIRLLETYGVEGRRREGLTGVWIGQEKIAAVGVAVAHWVCYHGVALNVGSDLSGFDLIVPCGIRHDGVTSLARLLGREVRVGEVKEQIPSALADVFETEIRQVDTATIRDLMDEANG